jgi:hypothetical protein
MLWIMVAFTAGVWILDGTGAHTGSATEIAAEVLLYVSGFFAAAFAALLGLAIILLTWKFVGRQIGPRLTWPPTLGRRQRVVDVDLSGTGAHLHSMLRGEDVDECVVCEQEIEEGEARVWRDETVVGPLVAQIHEEGVHPYCERCAVDPLDGMLEAERDDVDQEDERMPVGFAGEKLAVVSEVSDGDSS